LRRIAAETHWHLVLVGGEAEEARLQRLSSMIPLERLNVALHQPLTELAARLAECDAFIGHDSGITHLAASLGLRGLALWGETNPQIWRPCGDDIELLRDDEGLEKLKPTRVFAAISRLMKQKQPDANQS
jgi:ADP-heptose:LPS heptosyltransferase